MADNKTRPNDTDVTAFIDAVDHKTRRADAHALVEVMERLSGEQACMWGASIIGFGSYHYVYDSGREGDMLRVGFSPRKSSLVLYIMGGFAGYDALLARLGKHKTGKACLYINTLADVDMSVLEELITRSLAAMAEKYPDTGPA